MKKNSHKKFLTALSTLLAAALITSTFAFVSVSASPADNEISPQAEEAIPTDLGEPKIIFETSAKKDEPIEFVIDLQSTEENDSENSANEKVYVDFGDGKLLAYDLNCEFLTYIVSGLSLEKEIKVYSHPEIIGFSTLSQSMTKLDVTKCPKLSSLHVDNNELTSLDLSANTELKEINAHNNKLTSIDLSACTKLVEAQLCCNKLKSIKLPDAPAGEENSLSLHDNALSLADLGLTKSKWNYKCYCKEDEEHNPVEHSAYAPQSPTAIAYYVEAGKSIDLSPEMSIGVSPSDLTWYDNSKNQVTPTAQENGVFTFGEEFIGKRIHCIMTNPLYEGLEVSTTATDITPAVESLGDAKIICKTDKKKGDAIKFALGTVTPKSYVFVDFGGGKPVYCKDIANINGKAAGDTIKLYCTQEFSSVSCAGNGLSSIDVSNNASLTSLDCSNNSLTKLDLSKTVNLAQLNCSGNKLTKLDLTKSTHINELNCSKNALAALLTKNASKFTSVACDGNNLSFSNIGIFQIAVEENFSYAPQGKIAIQKGLKIDTPLDLSAEYSINGHTTTYKWYMKKTKASGSSEAFNEAGDSLITPTISDKGVFTFGEEFNGASVYCVMTNDEYPDLTLTTNDVYISLTGANPGTGESNLLTIIAVSLMAAAVLSVAIVLIINRKKRSNS